MRHHVKKIKFRRGQDANRSLIRKLALNFIQKDKINTTVNKAKILKSVIDRLVHKAKEKNETRRVFLLKILNEKSSVTKLFDVIAPVFADRRSGFVKIVKTGVRLGDGAEMARVEWVKQTLKVKNEIKEPRVLSNETNQTSEGKRD